MENQQEAILKEEIVENLKDCKYTEEEIIEMLINEDIEDIHNSYTDDFLNNLLTNGFKGYNNLTLTELKSEFNNRFEEEI